MGVADDENPRGAVQAVGDVVEVGLDGIEPVSYTHLDVYKRQGEDQSRGIQASLVRRQQGTRDQDVDIGAVSYTHLDVYKRQPPTLSEI